MIIRRSIPQGIHLPLWIIAVALFAIGADAAVSPVHSLKQLKFPSLNKINVPQPKRVELHNGMILFLLEDHELPLVSVSTLIRTGSRLESVAKAGLADITGTVIRTGGTPNHSGDKLDEELDRLGASVEFGIGEDSGHAGVSVLKADADKGLEILADLLQHPAFPEDKIELAKIAHRDAISRRNDEPMNIVNREFERLIYGKDSPYAHITEYKSIGAINRADLVAFHKQYFQPENVILGVWGDFDTAQMQSKIEKAFAIWPKGGNPKPKAPVVEPIPSDRIGLHFINKDDVNQSWVMMGQLGGRRDDPDYYALRVMNHVLGGGFSSRLFNEVRSRQGLAYSVFSGWSAGWDRTGSFIAGGGTKSQTTLKIISSIKEQISKMTEAEVTDAELASAKDSILKAFAFEFDSKGKIVGRLMSFEYYGYPNDWLQRFQDGIAKVTKADVLRVAKTHLKPDTFSVLVLGKEKDFEKPLNTLGKVTPVDITIPPPN